MSGTSGGFRAKRVDDVAVMEAGVDCVELVTEAIRALALAYEHDDQETVRVLRSTIRGFVEPWSVMGGEERVA